MRRVCCRAGRLGIGDSDSDGGPEWRSSPVRVATWTARPAREETILAADSESDLDLHEAPSTYISSKPPLRNASEMPVGTAGTAAAELSLSLRRRQRSYRASRYASWQRNEARMRT
jgi:hypothetical protein